MHVIYILHLAENKFYVGKTALGNLENRVEQHKAQQGASAWTSLYRVQSLVHSYVTPDALAEDHETERLMLCYGIDNVRGGMYAEVQLDSRIKTLLTDKFAHASNRCFVCGSTGHFASECGAARPEQPLRMQCFACGSAEHRVQSCPFANTNKDRRRCYRCLQTGHQASQCPNVGGP